MIPKSLLLNDSSKYFILRQRHVLDATPPIHYQPKLKNILQLFVIALMSSRLGQTVCYAGDCLQIYYYSSSMLITKLVSI